jgi:hypothetical protein
MGQCTKISEEIIDEVLVTIFPKKDIIEPEPITIRYNRPAPLETFVDNKCIPNPFKTFTSTSKNINNKESRSYTKGKILGLREGNHCHWCGEIGHIKKTCFKKQAFDNSKGKSHNPNCTHHTNNLNLPSRIPKPLVSKPSHIAYDIDFEILIKGLNHLGKPEIPIDKLLQLRAMVNTLIYFHPSQRETREFRANLY